MAESLFDVTPDHGGYHPPRPSTASLDSPAVAMLDVILRRLVARGMLGESRSSVVRLAIAELYNQVVVRDCRHVTSDGGRYPTEVLARCHVKAAAQQGLTVELTTEQGGEYRAHPSALRVLESLCTAALGEHARCE